LPKRSAGREHANKAKGAGRGQSRTVVLLPLDVWSRTQRIGERGVEHWRAGEPPPPRGTQHLGPAYTSCLW